MSVGVIPYHESVFFAGATGKGGVSAGERRARRSQNGAKEMIRAGILDRIRMHRPPRLWRIRTACRTGQSPTRGEAGFVLAAVRQQSCEFRLADIEQACPGVGLEWIRSLPTDLKAAGEATCQGKGPAARWRYFGSKSSNS